MINVTNILFIEFVKFETKQDQFCVSFSLAQLPTQNARVFLLSHFLKIRNGFSLLIPASRTCSMLREVFFVPYYVKCYPNSESVAPF